MQKLVILLALTLLAQTGFAKPGASGSSGTPVVGEQTSQNSGSQTEESDEDVEQGFQGVSTCEVILTGYGDLLRTTQKIHKQIANREFEIYSGQGAGQIIKNFGLDKVEQEDFERLRVRVVEGFKAVSDSDEPSDYLLQFYLDGQSSVVSAIPFDMPPVFVWLGHSSSKQEIQSYIRKNDIGHHEIAQNLDLSDRTPGVFLKTKGPGKTYMVVQEAVEHNVVILELGVYLPCKSGHLRGASGRTHHLTSEGWFCKAPIMNFAGHLEPEEIAVRKSSKLN